jgi:hypothetical protein
VSRPSISIGNTFREDVEVCVARIGDGNLVREELVLRRYLPAESRSLLGTAFSSRYPLEACLPEAAGRIP